MAHFLRLPTRAHAGAFLLAAAGSSLAGACCVRPPLVEEWLDVGFRTPEQSVRTFQTAVRADSADLEYRCLSAGFKQRNHISKMVWAEVREKLREENPWLRKGLSDASIGPPLHFANGDAVLMLSTHGYTIRVVLVREDFGELWSGGERISDEEGVKFAEATGVQTSQDGTRWFYGQARMPAELPPGSEVTDVHIGREWKIDSFENVEAP
jgi:hypothetical protein